MSRRLNIALVAEEGPGRNVLRALETSEHRVAMVLTSPPEVPGSVVWGPAESGGHRVLPASSVKDPGLAAALRDERVDLLLNVHSLYIIKAPIIEAPRIGSYNLHPGPLPRYAGLNAPSWAIYRGERRHGVTVHRMLAGIDTGPIAYQTLFDLEETDTALSVGARCAERGLQLISTLIDAAAADPASIPRTEQDLSRREYFGREIPEGGVLSWHRPAAEVERFVRAFCHYPYPSPWGHPTTSLHGRDISVIKLSPTGEAATAAPGTVGFGPGGEARVACADEWLRLDLIKVGGDRVQPSQVFEPGDRLGAP